MAYYDALVAKWATLSTALTVDQRLAIVNSTTVGGASVDVPVTKVVETLMLDSGFLTLTSFAASTFTGVSAHDQALGAIKLLQGIAINPNAADIRMSNAGINAQMQGMMGLILTYESTAPGATGFSTGLRDKLLALSTSATPWWQANGYGSQLNANDLHNAGGLV